IVPLLAELDEQDRPSHSTLDKEKLWVVSRILRLRKEIPGAFIGAGSGYAPLPVTTGHAFAYIRTEQDEPKVAVITERHYSGAAATGGYGEHTVVIPEGTWTDVLTGTVYEGGAVLLLDMLSSFPVAVLRKEND